MVRPKVILKSEFVNILAFHTFLAKRRRLMKNKLTDIQEYLLFFSYSPFLEDFAILTTESNYFKLKIMESLLTG